ncbi:MAG: methyltransferase domain-containing protein [Candidatus Thorarchaeota archaeon]|nr:methyltransferase domain-containing protein [Candidatus Thorarchaeota archaeon]
MIADLPDGLRESGAIKVREKLGTISGGVILDVGTQDGDFITTLMKTLREYKSFVGIDILAGDLKKAKEKFKDAPVDLMEMNAETMSFPDNHFNTVCISYSIHHLENIDTVLAEMYRVLKPGGSFIIQELYSDGEQTQAQRVDRDKHNLNVKIDTILGIPHFEALSRQELRDAVNKVGLSAVEVYESSWGVKCLFCKEAPDCEDPHRKENVDYVIKDIDADLARIIDHPSYDELRQVGESIKERVKVTGSSAASVMYFFGKK